MGSRGRRGSDEHREFEDMAVAHVVGGLSLDEGRLFRSHLLECTACRARVGELRAIAHDLADVERDERRERAARRTETKAREDEEPELPDPPVRRLSGRTTLLIAVGLVLLMGLASWNFLLRGRVEDTERRMAQLRESVTVLTEGEEWQRTDTSAGVDGQVRTFEGAVVVMADGLASGTYGLYLLDGRERVVAKRSFEARNSLLYGYIPDVPNLDAAESAQLVRTDELLPQPAGSPVFEAQREMSITPEPEPVGDRGR
jgi:hypothetical protein